MSHDSQLPPGEGGTISASPGEYAPQSGWWWTPALRGADGLRFFAAGQRLPQIQTTDLGPVVWYFDPDHQQSRKEP